VGQWRVVRHRLWRSSRLPEGTCGASLPNGLPSERFWRAKECDHVALRDTAYGVRRHCLKVLVARHCPKVHRRSVSSAPRNVIMSRRATPLMAYVAIAGMYLWRVTATKFEVGRISRQELGAGPCATESCEPRQVRKDATVSRPVWVPQDHLAPLSWRARHRFIIVRAVPRQKYQQAMIFLAHEKVSRSDFSS
jgi:hypothetical protein